MRTVRSRRKKKSGTRLKTSSVRSRADKKLTNDEMVAYHEAGHAVVAVALKRRFSYVTIRPDSRCEGAGHIAMNVIVDQKSRKRGKKFKWDMRDIAILLGGWASLGIVSGNFDFDKGEQADLVAAGMLMDAQHEDPAKVNAVLGEAQQFVLGLLTSPAGKAATRALAEALLNEPIIGYRKVRQIVLEAAQARSRSKGAKCASPLCRKCKA